MKKSNLHMSIQKTEYNLILKNHFLGRVPIKELIYSYFIPVQQCESLDIFIKLFFSSVYPGTRFGTCEDQKYLRYAECGRVLVLIRS